MKKIFGSAILVPLMLILAGCGGSDRLTDLRIGLIAELTGETSAVGVSCKNAAEMAVREINDSGGLTIGNRNYKVKLVVVDNAGKADASAAAARKLIDSDKVIAIVGPNESRFAIPASDAAESAGTVLLSPASTTPRTTLDARTGARRNTCSGPVSSIRSRGRCWQNSPTTGRKPARPPSCSTIWWTTTGALQRFSGCLHQKGG